MERRPPSLAGGGVSLTDRKQLGSRVVWSRLHLRWSSTAEQIKHSQRDWPSGLHSLPQHRRCPAGVNPRRMVCTSLRRGSAVSARLSLNQRLLVKLGRFTGRVPEGALQPGSCRARRAPVDQPATADYPVRAGSPFCGQGFARGGRCASGEGVGARESCHCDHDPGKSRSR